MNLDERNIYQQKNWESDIFLSCNIFLDKSKRNSSIKTKSSDCIFAFRRKNIK